MKKDYSDSAAEASKKEIANLQYELNAMVRGEYDFKSVYEVSLKLDELIVGYYRNNIKSSVRG